MDRKLIHLLALLAIASVLAVVGGCSDDDDPADPGDGDDYLGGTISGVVAESDGDPIEGATIAAGGRATTTNQDGFFVLTEVPAGEGLLAASKTGYLPTFRVEAVTEGGSLHYADLVLILVETGTIDGAAGGSVETADGHGRVEFGPNSFVDGAGNPYTGEVTVQLNALRPGDGGFYGAFPGEFAGIDLDGAEVPFVSFGFMSVEIAGEDKAPLELADGVTATLELGVAQEMIPDAPATIPLWFFDEAEGVWREEGEATLDENVYLASVSHFTTWNWDLPVEDICGISGVVLGEDELPIAGARIISRGVDWAIMDEVVTNAAGAFTVRAVRNAATDVWAIMGSMASDAVRVTVGDVCPYVLEEPLVLTLELFTISLTWGETPEDLDAHLLVPMTWDLGFDHYHLYYGNMGTLSDNPYAFLDTDAQYSYGPEIIRGTRLYEGRFQCWVHNYADGGEPPTEPDPESSANLRASGARVQLQVGSDLRIYEASALSLTGADTTGWWHVFDLVVDGGVLSVESIMEFQPRFSDTGVYSGDKALKAKNR
ncbi:MAG TPA: carboxypeptidase regulatory-like domain-containing protein [Candidatus Krumholzibacteria bacterium]|nr:carboxypeptidase regulatory-like domain-containing protein [Candidatus Krumholzibacteria bacterium]HPD70170.1 carboxypeptidase regulatory-like domain-containing protein [Candidatus Krumholzibacteria bacterium]HRY40130.1 carboxypeptidase regulatory-like domain-containing protein [Candidatus Krumholzibacteria bacterium]